jgi:hypothetical protein
MRIALLFILAIGITGTACAQDTARKKYSAQQLNEDLSLVKRVLTERHPDLYAFVPKDSLDKGFSRIEAVFNDSMPVDRAFELMSDVVNNIGCGHTMLAPPSSLVRTSYKNEKRLPFKLKYSDDKLYITRSYLDDTTFALGWQLVKVGEHPVEELENRFMRYYSTDGYNKTLKYRQMETGFRDDYAMFIDHPDSLSIECITRLGERKSLKVPTLLADTINARYARRYDRGKIRDKQLSLKIIDSTNTAVMTIGTFHPKILGKGHENFRRYVRRSFRQVRRNGINDLIIDLRNDPGGYSDYGIYLYSFMADSSFKYFDRMELPTKKPINFLRYTDKTFLFNGLYMLVSRDRCTGTCRYKLEKGLRYTKPKRHAYKGKVYVLINGNSFSNSCNFSALAQYHKRAVFIGEETGGRYDGCNGSAYVMVTLPNTKMKLNLPLVKNVYPFPGYPYKGRGVMPDYPVAPSVDDVIKSVDTEMKFTLGLIKKAKSVSKK